jgi:integrase
MAHVEKRGKDSFRLVVPLGFNTEGKRVRKTKTVKCKNNTEAEKELAKFVVEIETGEYIAPQKMTFSMFIEEWKEKYARKHLGPKTFENYMSYLEQRIIPTFGHFVWTKLTLFKFSTF